MVAATGRKAEESARTRAAILDAAEAIMRAEGYAAASARRVADKAGVNLGLIHYHFGGMDDVFLALFRRADDQHAARYQGALESGDPLRALWEAHNDSASNELIIEFMALANHRKVMREEIARSVERVRSLQAAVFARVLPDLGVKLDDWPPVVLALLVSATSRAIATEATLGVSTGHSETLAFLERRLRQLEGRGTAGV